MHRVFSLLALGSTLVLAAAQPKPVLTLISIKAVDSTKEKEDQWSIKGYLYDADSDAVLGIAKYGLEAELQDVALDTLDGVSFDPEECKVLRNKKGVTCKTTDASVSLWKTNRRREMAVVAQEANKKTSHSAFSFYKVTGMFRRQEFQKDPVLTPLTAVFTIGGTPVSAINTDCSEKTMFGGKEVGYHCKHDKGYVY